jgi:methylmalonyl-CoA/ethylmalonyl-CoA epimerase
MYRKIDHVAIAVRSLDSALEVYREAMRLKNCVIEEIPEQKTRVALLDIGESRIELLEPMGNDSPVAGFLAKRGEGMHHICFQVDDLASELERMAASGLRLIDALPRVGAGGNLIAFVHPAGTSGVLIELSQSGENSSYSHSK